ncbi:uncharacterized protein ACMZJ9_016385 isoform 3-T3 [Mantella aurantiaca]
MLPDLIMMPILRKERSPITGCGLMMEEAKGHVAENILNLALEIIYLLTGENCIVFKLSDGWVLPNMRNSQSFRREHQPDMLIFDGNNDKKILEVTQKMIGLLTGEVPIRCQDVTVYFSMEEWEYIEGHKDLYKDVMMEKPPPLTSPDGSSNRNPPERCPRPLYSRDSTQEHQEIPQEDQVDGSNNRNTPERCPRPLYSWDSTQEHQEILQEDQDDGSSNRNPPERCPRPLYSRDSKQEHQEIPQEDQVDGSSNRNTPERCPRPLYSRDSTQEHQEIPQEDQEEHLMDVKFEAAAVIEMDVKSDDWCKEEEIPPEISTDGQLGGNTWTISSPDVETDDHFTCDSSEENLITVNFHPEITNAHLSYDPSTHGRYFVDHSLPMIHHTAPSTTHDGEKPYMCSECGKSFTQKSNLVAHQKLHTGVRPFSCPQCGKCFKRNTHLVIHQRVHTGEKPYSCLQCGKSFTRKPNLISHQRSHTGEKPYSCSVCGKRFSEKAYYLRHERTHSGHFPYSCPQCGKGFAHKSILVTHQKNHTGVGAFSCPECEKAFKFEASLAKHQKTHQEGNPYCCPECGKCFVTKPHLLRHFANCEMAHN